jgi:hypothetical protein
MLNDVYRCLYNDMKYKYDKLQEFKIKGRYYVVFGRFMYCYILVLVVAVMMLYYMLVYRHCVDYYLVLISI